MKKPSITFLFVVALLGVSTAKGMEALKEFFPKKQKKLVCSNNKIKPITIERSTSSRSEAFKINLSFNEIMGCSHILKSVVEHQRFVLRLKDQRIAQLRMQLMQQEKKVSRVQQKSLDLEKLIERQDVERQERDQEWRAFREKKEFLTRQKFLELKKSVDPQRILEIRGRLEGHGLPEIQKIMIITRVIEIQDKNK